MKPDFSSATVVLNGRFEPDAFLPDALAEGKLISKKQAEQAKFGMLLRGQHVQFRFAWGELLVTAERFQIGTEEAPFVRISDFAMKALSDLPTKSIVKQFGINLESHFNLRSVEARDALGTRLAPPKEWGAWGEEILHSMHGAAQENPGHGGMLMLQMRRPFVGEQFAGWLDVTVGPSVVVRDTGVFFRTNNHYQLSPKQQKDASNDKDHDRLASDTRALLMCMSSKFDDSISKAESIFLGVLAP